MTILDFIRFFRLEKKEMTPSTQLAIPSDLFNIIKKTTSSSDRIDFFCNHSHSVCLAIINRGQTWIAKRGSKIITGKSETLHPELNVVRETEQQNVSKES